VQDGFAAVEDEFVSCCTELAQAEGQIPAVIGTVSQNTPFKAVIDAILRMTQLVVSLGPCRTGSSRKM
jgi:hypothetical protein